MAYYVVCLVLLPAHEHCRSNGCFRGCGGVKDYVYKGGGGGESPTMQICDGFGQGGELSWEEGCAVVDFVEGHFSWYATLMDEEYLKL